MIVSHRTKIYFQLLEVFTLREIKSRYRASILGFLWIIIYPLTTAFILNFVFGSIIRVNSGNIPYLLMLLSAYFYWNFFQQGLILAKDSLVWNRNLVIKTVFPKEVLPLSYILSKIPDFLINLVVFFLFYLFNGYRFDLTAIWILVFILPVTLFSIGISLVFAVLNAVFRDFGRIIELITTILFYATPIIYSDQSVPVNLRLFLYINPLSLAIMFTRSLVFEKHLRPDLFLLAFLIGFPFFIFGIYFFRKMEKRIVDLI